MTRLIDADALKEELNKKEVVGRFNTLLLIDNAPTVVPDNDIFEWCTDCKEYDQEKHCCPRWSSKIREAVEEIKQCKLDELRPKGEWIETNSYDENIICSFCKTEFDGDIKLVCGGENPNFCPNCGADMRKGGKEE